MGAGGAEQFKTYLSIRGNSTEDSLVKDAKEPRRSLEGVAKGQGAHRNSRYPTPNSQSETVNKHAVTALRVVQRVKACQENAWDLTG